MPVLLCLDLLLHGLKKAVAPKLAGKEGRGFVKVLLNELEGASNGRWRRSRRRGDEPRQSRRRRASGARIGKPWNVRCSS
jgi:hypothetical protein